MVMLNREQVQHAYRMCERLDAAQQQRERDTDRERGKRCAIRTRLTEQLNEIHKAATRERLCTQFYTTVATATDSVFGKRGNGYVVVVASLCYECFTLLGGKDMQR